MWAPTITYTSCYNPHLQGKRAWNCQGMAIRLTLGSQGTHLILHSRGLDSPPLLYTPGHLLQGVTNQKGFGVCGTTC